MYAGAKLHPGREYAHENQLGMQWQRRSCHQLLKQSRTRLHERRKESEAGAAILRSKVWPGWASERGRGFRKHDFSDDARKNKHNRVMGGRPRACSRVVCLVHHLMRPRTGPGRSDRYILLRAASFHWLASPIGGPTQLRASLASQSDAGRVKIRISVALRCDMRENKLPRSFTRPL